jgi:hypothetical protein
LPPLNFLERGPLQAPRARHSATLRLQHTAPRGGLQAQHATRTEPARVVPPGIYKGKVTNGQQSTDPIGAGDRKGPPDPSPRRWGEGFLALRNPSREEPPCLSGGAPLNS